MTDSIQTDPRAALLNDEGLAELQIYLDWISEAGLSDSEASFVSFVVGRAGLKDPRHLLAVWEAAYSGQQLSADARLQVMRFFLNPGNSDFRNEEAAGWFDFLPTVYELAPQVPSVTIYKPVFQKVGFSS